MKRWWLKRLIHGSLASAVVAIGSTTYAQSSEPAPVSGTRLAPKTGSSQMGARNHVILNRLVTLSLTAVSLEHALDALQDKAGVVIAYGDRVVPLHRRVSLSVTDVPVLTALRALLKGTDVGIIVSSSGKIVLYKASAAQDSVWGVVAGRVTEASSKRGIALVHVMLEGTTHATLTDARGHYTLTHIPPGKYVLAGRLLGYGVTQRSISVTGNDTIRIGLSLSSVPERLEEVVTTGAGNQRRIEVGNSIATINADSVTRTTLIRTLSDLIQSRAPGTQVSATSGTVGSGSRIRIRGISSVLSNSDPIVIVDGVRVDAMYSQNVTGNANTTSSVGQNQVNWRVPATSRLNDIDPNMIESVEILKGPAASTLYGSDAANGVIVITTKRGHPGPTRWTVSTTQGISNMDAKFQDAWLGWGTSDVQPSLANCTLQDVAALICTQDSVTHYNPLNAKATSPFGTGRNSTYNMQVSGGSPQFQYFIGGTYTNDLGFLKMPSDQAKVAENLRGGAPLPAWAKRPNALKSTNISTTLTAQTSPKLDFALNANYITESHRDASQGAVGFINRSYTTPGYIDTVGAGWGTDGPAGDFLKRNRDAIHRINGGVTAHIRPWSILAINAVYGVDYTSRHDDMLLRNGDVIGSVNFASTRGISDGENMGRDANVTGTFDLPLGHFVQLRSSVGGQYHRQDTHSVQITATGLAAGSDVLSQASQVSAPWEVQSSSATAGWFINESLALRDRLFLTVATRGDAGSAFGRQAKAIIYPKFNASWVISQEPFFPKSAVLSNVRLRGAFGQAGVQPSIDARFRSYRSLDSYPVGTVVPGIMISTVGNTGLVPERSAEYEGGLDVGLWEDRVTLEATSYYKYTHNAIIQRILPPSLGIGTRQENIGEVQNRGLELLATARPIVTRMVDWSLTVGFSKNSNKLVKLGTDSMQTAYSAQTRYVAGYPLNGFWGRPIKWYADVDGNGILTTDEVQLADSAVYVGQPLPKAEMSLHTNLALLSGRVTFAAGFSFDDGLTQFNSALWSQCLSGRCQLAVDKTVSLANQAMAISTQLNSYYAGYETVSWLRWNDVSMTVIMPQSIARLLKSRDGTIMLLGRNLGLWSKYRGADPEVNSANAGNYISDAGGVPQTRDWSIRVNLHY